MAADYRVSRTQRLQDKVKLLEEQVRQAEEAELESSRRSSTWTAAVLSGKVNISPAPLEPLVTCFPAPVFDDAIPPFLKSMATPDKSYVSTVPRFVIHQELLSWDQSQELPIGLRQRLLSIFLPHRDQFNFDFHIERLKEVIVLPSNHPDALHPSLIYGIALAACSCAGSDLRGFERVFLERTQTECENALANVERIEHFLWAFVLLGWYWAREGNAIRAHAVSTTVAHWAVACGLHCISDPEAYIQDPGDTLLEPLRDIRHFAERINLWWAIFLLDRRIALATGLPALIQECRVITTVWPRSCEEVKKNSSPSLWGRQSINEMFIHGTGGADVSKDSLLCLRAKSGVLLDRAMWFSQLTRSGNIPDDYWTIHFSIDSTINQVLKTLPGITDQREIEEGEFGKRLNPSIVLSRSYVLAAAIVLYSIDADPDRNPLAYSKCLAVSKVMARDVQLVGNVSFLYSHACLGPTWVTGAEVCLREVQRLSRTNSPDENKLKELRNDLDVYIRGFLWLTSHYPGLVQYIHRLGAILFPQSEHDTLTNGSYSPASSSPTTISTPSDTPWVSA